MNNTKICLLALSTLLILTIFRYIVAYYEPLSVRSLSLTLVTVFLATFIFFFVRREKILYLRNNFFQITTIFVIGFIIVHFFEYLAYVTGEHTQIKDIEFVDSSYVNGAAMVSCACLIAFYIGAVYAKQQFRIKERSYSKNCLFLDFIMFISLLVFYFSAGDDYFEGGYGEAMNVTGMSLFAQISQTFIVASSVAHSAIIIYKNNRQDIKGYVREFSVLYYISVFSYCLLVLKSGDRGPLIHLFLCYWIPYFYVGKRKIKFFFAIVLLSAGALFMSLLGTVRAMDGSLNIDKVVEAQKFRNERYADDNIVFTSTAELSNVVRAYHVLYYFAETKFIVYGAGFVNQVLGIVPGLRYVLYPLIGIDDTEITTAHISTILLQQDHGMGSTCVADTYFNFGAYGTIIVFFFVGIIFRKMDVSAYHSLEKMSPFVVCTIICYMMFAIYIGRGYLFSPINILAYSWALFMINNKIFKAHV